MASGTKLVSLLLKNDESERQLQAALNPFFLTNANYDPSTQPVPSAIIQEADNITARPLFPSVGSFKQQFRLLSISPQQRANELLNDRCDGWVQAKTIS